MANITLTRNFTIGEFTCHDGTDVPWSLVDNVQELANNLQVLREHLGIPIRINSGYRNPTYNAQVGGEVNSFHTYGKAADISCASKTPKELHMIIEKLIKEGKMKQGGLGLYPTFVHYDVRGNKARW